MAPYMFQFRELFYELLEAEGEVEPLLGIWASKNRDILEPYRKLRRLNALDYPYEMERDELYSLYALSRVCDLLIEPFQPRCKTFPLSHEFFVTFWNSLGIVEISPSNYHPLWCEIVQIEEDEAPDAFPHLQTEFWPSLWWGDLLICRAGVGVRAGRDILNSDVAASSPLYFAYTRAYRKAHDLSHGWGSNSQWNTDFRRDYVCNDFFVFNADGTLDFEQPTHLHALTAHQWLELAPQRFFPSRIGDDYGLTLEERQELLVNRCRVRCPKEGDEYWPWDDTLVVWRDTPLF